MDARSDPGVAVGKLWGLANRVDVAFGNRFAANYVHRQFHHRKPQSMTAPG